MFFLKVSEIILHRGFNCESYDCDIALIKLTKEAELTTRVQLICLPKPEVDLDGKEGWVGRPTRGLLCASKNV